MVRVGGWGNESLFRASPRPGSRVPCSVFVSCVRASEAVREILGARGLRRSRVLLLLLLLLLPSRGPRGLSRGCPVVVPGLSRGCPVVVPWLIPWVVPWGCPVVVP